MLDVIYPVEAVKRKKTVGKKTVEKRTEGEKRMVAKEETRRKASTDGDR